MSHRPCPRRGQRYPPCGCGAESTAVERVVERIAWKSAGFGAVMALSCGISAGSGREAPGHGSCKRMVSGSNPLTGSTFVSAKIPVSNAGTWFVHRPGDVATRVPRHQLVATRHRSMLHADCTMDARRWLRLDA